MKHMKSMKALNKEVCLLSLICTLPHLEFLIITDILFPDAILSFPAPASMHYQQA